MRLTIHWIVRVHSHIHNPALFWSVEIWDRLEKLQLDNKNTVYFAKSYLSVIERKYLITNLVQL